MGKKDLLIVIYTIFILLSIMYATQPLQPLLASEFGVSMAKASTFTAVIMFSLAIAPIMYGYMMERVCAKKVLFYASLTLLVTNFLLYWANSYEMFLTLRIIESLVIPAILTGCLSVLAHIDKENIQRNMAIYVSATVLGGMFGRVFSGFIATEFGWRMVFLSLSFALLMGLIFLRKLSFDGEASLTKAKINDVKRILLDSRFMLVYFLMFCMFFVFAGALNILPFRLKVLFPDVTETMIGLSYLGYSMGIIVALYSKRIIKLFRGKANALVTGVGIFIGSTILLSVPNLWFIFGMLFVFCIGMFTVHTIATGLANSMKQEQKSLTSGMYLTFYYLGGAIGSIVPVMVYEQFGWDKVLVVFVALLSLVMFILLRNRRLFT